MAKRRPSGDGMVRRKKEDGRWEGRIVVGHKENGESIFRYVYGKTQKELLEKLYQNRALYRDVELTEASRMTLGEWLDKWLEEYASVSVRESTLNGYRGYTDNYIKPNLGDKVISKVTTADVQKLYKKLKKEGRIKEHPEMGYQLSDGSIRRIHSMLHLALGDAMRAQVIPVNPTDGATVPKANRQAKRILNKEELERFMAEIEKDAVWKDFFYTELTTGLRRGEICGLQWQDFDEAKGTLKISRTLHCTKIGEYTTGDTKTGKGLRTITLPPSTAQLLRERKKEALTEWIFHDPVRPEHPVVPNSAYKRMKKILADAGLPNIRFHDLRHTFATHALTSGVDAKTLSGILGHANASFTLDTYTHVTGDMQERASSIVGNFVEDIFGKGLSCYG